MTRRTPVAWYLGLLAITLISAVLSIVMIWFASGQQILVDEFYTSNAITEPITDEEYRYWDAVARGAYQQVTVVAPTLLTGAIVAMFAMLAVLAFRWERRHRLPVSQTEATAES